MCVLSLDRAFHKQALNKCLFSSLLLPVYIYSRPHTLLCSLQISQKQTNKTPPCILAKVIQETSYPLEVPAPFKQPMG